MLKLRDPGSQTQLQYDESGAFGNVFDSLVYSNLDKKDNYFCPTHLTILSNKRIFKKIFKLLKWFMTIPTRLCIIYGDEMSIK